MYLPMLSTEPGTLQLLVVSLDTCNLGNSMLATDGYPTYVWHRIVLK